jgi:hypothetical protein
MMNQKMNKMRVILKIVIRNKVNKIQILNSQMISINTMIVMKKMNHLHNKVNKKVIINKVNQEITIKMIKMMRR